MTTKKDESAVDVPAPISEYLLERLAAEDLPAARAASLHARLQTDAEGRARLDGLRASNAEILRAHPPALVADEIRRRLGGERERAARAARSPWRPLAFGVPMLALAAALVLTVRETGGWPFGRSHTGVSSDADGSGDTLKGLRPLLRVYRKVSGGVERLQDGARTHAGDELQLAYVAAGHHFGAVVSTDGAGHVTFHLPATPGPAARLRTDGETALPSAYELDAAPGFERFVFVAADAPFDAAVLADIASGRAAPPAGLMAVFFQVRKP